MLVCRKYSIDDLEAWNKCVKESKTPLFFFYREFMEYHSDRFTDSSLMFFEAEKLVAVLPASLHGDQLIAHGGLTYGALLFSQKVRSSLVLEIFQELKSYCLAHEIRELIYKSIPYIFHEAPSDEDLYGLNVFGATLLKRELSSAIDISNRPKLSKGRKWLVNKAKKEGVVVNKSEEWGAFHSLLSDVLKRHNAAPVHSASELALLSSRFPQNIALYVAEREGQLLAATLLFKFGNVIHTQYMATSDEGKEYGALDYLVESCIQTAQTEHRSYFSFGISTEEGGKVLNEGLVAQKEAFGARAVVLDTYCLKFK